MELSSETWSAIIGAIVGGAISFILQIIATRSATRERLDAKKQADKAIANVLVIKVVRIASDLANYYRHVLEQRQSAAARGLVPDSWGGLLPIANHPIPVSFAPEELALLLDLKEDDLFNRVIILDQLHASTIAIWAVYAEHRSAMRDIPSDFDSTGTVGAVELTGEERRRWFPRIAELDSLVPQLVHRAQQDADESRQVMMELGAALARKRISSIRLEVDATNPSTSQ